MAPRVPVVVIVGGGFAGLSAAKALAGAPVDVLLIDRSNHHLFQPLLYQVAICTLSPAQIASPIRDILHRQENTTVVMGEGVGVDKAQKQVFVSDADRERVPIHYDYLILATGATHSYCGHQEFGAYAPALKNLGDAVEIRNKILAGIRGGRGRILSHTRSRPSCSSARARRRRDGKRARRIGANSLRSRFRRIDPRRRARPGRQGSQGARRVCRRSVSRRRGSAGD